MSVADAFQLAKHPPHKLIRASAGSGKTHALTSQYLSLLRRGAAVDSIMATTFTRKAAGEILGRVVTRLLKATRGEPDAGPGSAPLMPADEATAMLRRLAERLHRVNISTIDSFFHRLGQAFRLELDLPLEPRLIDEASAEAEALRGEAIEAVLAEAATDDAAFKALLDLLRRLDHGKAGRSVTDAIDRIVRAHAEVYRQAPDRAVWTALEVPDELDDTALNAALDRWREMRHHLPLTGKGTPRVSWQNSWERIGRQVKDHDWDNIASSGMMKFVLEGKTAFDRVDIPEAWRDALEPFLQQLTAKLLGRIARQTEATHELMQRFTRRYDERCAAAAGSCSTAT